MKGKNSKFKRRTVTYSPAYTVVPTYECFNRCTYCNFRTDAGQSPWLDLDVAKDLLRTIRRQGVVEVLVLSGEVAPNSPDGRPGFVTSIASANWPWKRDYCPTPMLVP